MPLIWLNDSARVSLMFSRILIQTTWKVVCFHSKFSNQVTLAYCSRAWFRFAGTACVKPQQQAISAQLSLPRFGAYAFTLNQEIDDEPTQVDQLHASVQEARTSGKVERKRYTSSVNTLDQIRCTTCGEFKHRCDFFMGIRRTPTD